MGEVYFSNQKYKTAQVYFEKAVRINPFNPFVHMRLIHVYDKVRVNRGKRIASAAVQLYRLIREILMKDLELAQELLKAKNEVVQEIRKVIVGQDKVIEDLLVALFCKGHCLFVGVPGLAKTLLVSTLSQVLNLGFSRIQFTPDLMPSDITGTDILHDDPVTGKRVFSLSKDLSFRTLYWQMKSIVPHPKLRQPCFKPCRKKR